MTGSAQPMSAYARSMMKGTEVAIDNGEIKEYEVEVRQVFTVKATSIQRALEATAKMQVPVFESAFVEGQSEPVKPLLTYYEHMSAKRVFPL